MKDIFSWNFVYLWNQNKHCILTENQTEFGSKSLLAFSWNFWLVFEKSTTNKNWQIKTKFSCFLTRGYFVHFRLKMATLIATKNWHPVLPSWSKTKMCSMELSKKVKLIDVKLTKNQKTIKALSILQWIRNKRYCLESEL